MSPLEGHSVLMLSTEPVIDAAAGRSNLLFNDDSAAQKLFVGESCGLCGQSADHAYGGKGL